MQFLKLDLADEEDLQTAELKADNMLELLQSELDNYFDDDRLCPCHGVELSSTLSYTHGPPNTIQFAPGDGGEYTIAQYYPDTDEGRAELAQEIADREE